MSWLQSWGIWPVAARGRLLRMWGVESQARVYAGCFFGGTNIRLGRSFINHGVFLDNTARIVIGDRCAIGMQTMILTSDHEAGPPEARAAAVIGRPVTIGDGCWLGARVMVMPGVTIGSGCVIGAGAIVTKDCEPHGQYVGQPARRIKELA
jgi:maltose O-acetyltransferase